MKVMGIDCGTRKATVVIIEDNTMVYNQTFEPDESLDRAECLGILSAWVQYQARAYQPDWVWIESIIVGNNRKYSIKLAEVFGAVLSQLVLPALGIGTVDNKQWKKALIGNGNASKEDIQTWLQLEHGSFALLCDDDQDMYDATCIALYGREIVGRADGLQLD